MSERAYVLGTGDDEFARLALQNRLWSDVAIQAWRRANLRIGDRVLDVGCGPGYAAADLSDIVTHHGRVVGVDESSTFVAQANQLAQARGIAHLQARVGDVQQLDQALTDEARFDIAYARWVLCFVPDPTAVVRGIANALKPGGRLVVHDYFNYGSMTLAPRRRSHDLAVAATIRSWSAHGGNPDIGEQLPAVLQQHGMRVDEVCAHTRIARGSDSMFAWPNTWWHTFAPKLVAMGELQQRDCDELFADLKQIEEGNGFVQCPPVYEFLATKL